MLNVLISVVGLILTILLVVGVHELGHFLVARSLKIKVLRFSIGFGKILYKWSDKKGTEFAISAIPLGGYVKLLNEEEDPVAPEDLHLAFNRQSYLKKIAVIAAGPLFNLIFAFLIYWGLFFVGFESIVPMIGKIIPHSIAADSGIQPNQEILQIDKRETPTWIAIIVELLSHAGNKDSLQLSTLSSPSSSPVTYHLNLTNWHIDELRPDPLNSLGIVPYEPFIPPVIGKIGKDTPAEFTPLREGDEIISLNGHPIKDWIDLAEITYNNPNKKILFKIKRDNRILSFPVLMSSQRDFLFRKHGFIGISPNFKIPKQLLRDNKSTLSAGALHAFQSVTTFTKLNFIMLGKMLTGKISLKSLGGPISIFESAGTSLNNGLVAFLGFLAFLSISIGTINIIPIPGLDGGHIFFETIELIIRKPLDLKAQMLFYRLGIILLVLLMFQAMTNDLLRL